MRSRSVVRVLMALGIVGTVMAASKYHAARIADPPYDFTGSFRLWPAIAFAGLLLLGAYALGLPDSVPTRRRAVAVGIGVPTVAALGISLLQLVVGSSLLPRFVVLGSTLVLAPFLVLCARMGSDADARTRRGERVLVVGDLVDVAPVAVDLEIRTEVPATLVDVMSLDMARPTRGRRPIAEMVRDRGVTLVVLDAAAQTVPGILGQVTRLHQDGIRVRTLVDFYEDWLGKLPVSELERSSLFFDIAEIHGNGYANLKRLFDVIGGALLSIAAVVVIPVVLVANRFGNRGPLLFRQERVGKGGEVVEILKLRTMRPGSSDGSWTTEQDPRITPVGRFLRRSHLDELPQAWNVLRGDLSLVGPRPEQPRYVEELTDKLPFYGMRHLVRPGLTGWAQVKYGYAGDHADALEKLQYEFFYLRHQSLGLDLRIIVRTFRSLLGGEGAGR